MPLLQSPAEKLNTLATEEAAPRMASPAGFEPNSEDDDNNNAEPKLLASVLMFDKHMNT